VRATVTLAQPTDLRLRVVDWDGRTVRELVRGRRPAGPLTRSWDGRDQEGRIVPEGPYRIVASRLAAADGPDGGPGQAAPGRAEAWLTVANERVYPPRPGFITVALDPGHGGPNDGAVGADGTREADLNLDIGLRLARMLESAGVRVVLTRHTDRAVNEPPRDLTGDGRADETDELAARPDIANQARADLFIAIHNNVAVNRAVGGPSTFYVAERTFGERSERLARLVQAEMVATLREFATEDWRPYDHGALTYPYYVLRDYDPPRLIRPTRMPGVLSEGLFLSNPRELRLLQRPVVRQAMAAAYYRAIAAYLADRGHQVGYRAIGRPEQAVAGQPATFELEVRNQGSEPMRGWDLVVDALPAAGVAGTPQRGQRMGERPIPRLQPGRAARLRVTIQAPPSGQPWTLRFEARDQEGRRASSLGSPPWEEPLTPLDPGSSMSLGTAAPSPGTG
jgi:N-acetylmuramoyl-L-alanine amidase